MKKYNVINDEQKDENRISESISDEKDERTTEADSGKAKEEIVYSEPEPEYEDFEDTLNANLAMNAPMAETLEESSDGISETTEEYDTGSDDFDEDSPEDDYDKKDKKKENQGNGFGAFFVEVVQNIHAAVHRNSKLAMLIGGGVVLLIVVIFIVLGVLGKRGSQNITQSLSANEPALEVQPSSGLITVPNDPLQQDAYPEVNELVKKYFEARKNNDTDTLLAIRNFSSIDLLKIEQLSQYVEDYQNIRCYTKAGPLPDSYIVYACYDVKIKNWEVTAPSELTLLICTDENGSLYIYSGDMDQNIADYIVNISSQDDVVDLITRINTEYQEIMDANPDFAVYIEAMNQTIKDSVGEQLAAAEVSASENEAAAEVTTVSENGETTAETPNEPEIKEVKANTTVNVRASDSEQADKLGKVEAGTVLVCKQQKLNGWTEVIYNGESGYIKSDYVTVVGAENPDGLPETHGKVTAKDTVNIRSSADVNGSKIGIAYAGESFELVKKDGEWTQIIYNGQVAYVKSEYVE